MERQPPAPQRKREIIICSTFTLGVFIVLWLRRPDCLLNAQFWAEDGAVFFREQVLFGFQGALVRPYSGYLHVIPRMIAALVSLLPVRWAPFGFNLCSLSVEAICCGAFFWPCYRGMIASDLLRAVCCLSAASSVAAGSELIATLANVQWFLCILSLLLILITAKRMEVTLTILQVCIAFTAPVTLLYVPMLLWRIKKNRAVLKIRPVLHLIALFLQALIMRHDLSSGPRPVFQFNPLFLATIGSGLSRCVLTPLIGSSFLTDNKDAVLLATLARTLIVITVLATLLTLRLWRSPELKWLLGAAYVGIGSLLAVLYGRGLVKPFVTMDGLRHYTAERYFLIGTCMFVFCLALGIQTFVRAKNPFIAAALLAVVFSLGIARNFSANKLPDLHWQENAARIEQWQAARKRHEPTQTLVVPINPNLQLILN